MTTIRFTWRILRGRLVMQVGDSPPMIMGRILHCPHCGSPTYAGA